MEWTSTTIALTGFIVGIFSNPLPIIGGIAFNFLVPTLLLAYQQLAKEISLLPIFPPAIFIFIIAYAVGVFSIKFLSLLPIPIVREFALALRGGN